MLLQIITFYCACDDFLLAKGHREPKRTQMTQAEVMTCALVAAEFFCGNLRCACAYLKETGLIPTMLLESRFNRRLHRVTLADWQGVLTLLARLDEDERTFVIDSCPVPSCLLKRAASCSLFAEYREDYFGHCAAKDQDFFGLKAHVVTTSSGRPVEMFLSCGSCHDLVGLGQLCLDLPAGSELLADKGYTDYGLEDYFRNAADVEFRVLRRKDSLRPHSAEVTRYIQKKRKRIETTFSQVSTRLARRIHAVTEAGFESKVWAAFVAYALVGIAS